MKRALLLLACVPFVLSFAGCDDKELSSPVKKFELPAAASPPDAMQADEILYIVNELLGYKAENEKTFIKENAEMFKVPVSPEKTETLYLFMLGDLEIGLFAGSEKDRIVSTYVRTLFDNPMAEAQMMSFAGAFLAALEPNEYEKMLSSVMPAGEDNPDESKTASGEFWRIRYTKSLVNILPVETPANPPVPANP